MHNENQFTNQVDEQYHNLLSDILNNGSVVRDERTGVGTKAVFGRTLRFNMRHGLPVITTKKMYFKGIITELLWFLGNHLKDEYYQNLPVDNIRYMLDNDVNIWVGDCYKAYLNFCETEVNENNFNDVLFCDLSLEPNSPYRPLTQDEFIQCIKCNDNFALKFGNIGPGYGWQWNNFNGDYKSYIQDFWNQKFYNNKIGSYGGINQIEQVIEKLKTNPHDRRLIVSAWNPSAVDDTVLPPCHYGFSLYARELSFEERENYAATKFGLGTFEFLLKYDFKDTINVQTKEEYTSFLDEMKVPKYALSLMERQRSVDTFLGLPFNITSYAILLELIAREVNMVPDELIMSLENTHIYLNHIDAVKEQLSRESIYKLPKLKINSDNRMNYLTISDFEIEGYQSHGKIKADLNN